MSKGPIDIYLETISGLKYQLPVLPEEIQISSNAGNESVQTIALGEITILKRSQLKTLTIDSFFPGHDSYPFSRCRGGDFEPPNVYISGFNRIQKEAEPVKLTITNIGLSSFWVSIEEFSVTHGRSDDIHYSLSLKEYRPYGQTTMMLEKIEPLYKFDVEDDELREGTGQIRQDAGFAIGDRVLVSGMYYANSYGDIPILDTPTNFLMQPFSSALASVWAGRRDLGLRIPLVGQRCIIVDREMQKYKSYDVPVMGDVNIPSELNLFPFCIADLETRKTIGWVAETQMEHIQ